MIIEQVKKELTQHIIPFWGKLEDKENGGFYGFLDYNLGLDQKADKGVILHSRILWFYSSCYSVLKDNQCLELATHAYEFIKNYCVDYELGGVYWLVDYKGKPVDEMKHTYNIAFAIYALSAYYNATGKKEALGLAEKLFSDIEEKTLDQYGYMEAFSRDWKLVSNDALSENGLSADKTMNTILHLIEAYTELYKANKSEKVAERLKFQLSQMSDKVYNSKTNALRVFFNTKLEEIGDIHSYGHDIEATWLMDLACQTLGDKGLIEKFRNMNLYISKNIQNIAVENGAMNNERENDKIDKKRVWWVQAEAVVGFINAYENSKDESFLKTAKSIWEYTKENMIDKRDGSEWYSEVSFEGVPHEWKEIVGPWKCPYHNGRMCLEVIIRGIDF
ncbi:MAG: N-acylglucosamine 2-epimerase [Clostridiales bacterium]|nr:N-acylglucosamine 2-epimerase [Clostridiales bacterium]